MWSGDDRWILKNMKKERNLQYRWDASEYCLRYSSYLESIMCLLLLCWIFYNLLAIIFVIVVIVILLFLEQMFDDNNI
jgi:hypothetical protein